MNKPLLSTILITLLPLFSQAQFLSEKASIKAALSSAAANNKMIFLMMDARACTTCNLVADKALQDDALKQYLGSRFIVLRIGVNHPERLSLQQTYHAEEGNIVLFLDKQGTLIHRFNGSTTHTTHYIKECEIAYRQRENGVGIRQLEQTAVAGKLSTDDLYKLLQVRNELNYSIDSLLDQYVVQLPPDSLEKISVLQRIAQMSPILMSQADATLRSNPDLFRQAWYGLPLNDRIEINRRIIFKTREKAIREKDWILAMRVADFSQDINGNHQEGLKAKTYHLMEYYWGTGDTTSFLRTATNYYDNYYMTVSADSIKRTDSLQLSAMMKNRLAGAKDGSRVVFSFMRTAQYYCQELNNGAWRVYTLTDQPEHLEKALHWAAHANNFCEFPQAMDTYARLLYKQQKDRGQAIRIEEKAIALSKKYGLSPQAFEDVLEKMKTGANVIDEY